MLAVSIFAHPEKKTPCSRKVDLSWSPRVSNELKKKSIKQIVYIVPRIQSSHLCGQELLKSLKKNVGVLLLEDEHGPEADGLGTRATDVDADALRVLQDLVTSGRVPGDESTLALATEVLNLLRELGGKALEASVEVSASLGGVLDEVLALNLVENGAEENGASRVTEPASILLVMCKQVEA
jgi:hypothetical protein